MDVYYTKLLRKTIIVRNNIKNSMIKSFLNELDTIIDDRQQSVTNAYCTPPLFTIPQYDKGNIDKFSKVTNDIAPCLSIHCEWIEYQSIVTPLKQFWHLPAVTDDCLCVLCDMARNETLDVSKIRVVNDNKIVLVH